jgi:hypothetical protein
MAEVLDYVPFPAKVVDAIEESSPVVEDPSGKPVYVATH